MFFFINLDIKVIVLFYFIIIFCLLFFNVNTIIFNQNLIKIIINYICENKLTIFKNRTNVIIIIIITNYNMLLLKF